ncbi:putative uncharacterized protein DDB_G0282133 isoform X2 [Hydractinia symbiolongicarpus]|uniref:putative uncharacterized protein DDB_G0282133 isoform X2 n=1 Tax=Hydractinia symbiolongicarpus TaxID=13093 RepID=UPI00254A1C9E|nr:putative uncharacterized protein DDB_G0282133 isoform X2 [Hydractinia symbiolongicarpus]
MDKDKNYCDLCKLNFTSEQEFKEHGWSMLHHRKLDQEKGRNLLQLNSRFPSGNAIPFNFYGKTLQLQHNKGINAINYDALRALPRQNSMLCSAKAVALNFHQEPRVQRVKRASNTNQNSLTYKKYFSGEESPVKKRKIENKKQKDGKSALSSLQLMCQSMSSDDDWTPDSNKQVQSEKNISNLNERLQGLLRKSQAVVDRYSKHRNLSKTKRDERMKRTIAGNQSKHGNLSGDSEDHSDGNANLSEPSSIDFQSTVDIKKQPVAKANLITKDRFRHLSGKTLELLQQTKEVTIPVSDIHACSLYNTANNSDPNQGTSRDNAKKLNKTQSNSAQHDDNETKTKKKKQKKTVEKFLPEQPKKCTEKRKNNTALERGMIPLSDKDIFSKPNDPISNEVNKQLAFITSTDAVKVSPEKFQDTLPLFEIGTPPTPGTPSLDSPINTSHAIVTNPIQSTVISSMQSTVTSPVQSNVASSVQSTEDNATKLCKFKKRDGKFCNMKSLQKFCDYHNRVVDAVELYIKQKIEVNKSNVADAVSLIESPDKLDANVSVKVNNSDDSSILENMSHSTRKRSLSQGSEKNTSVSVDFAMLKDSINTSRQRSNSTCKSSDNSDGGSSLMITGQKNNVKVGRFKYLKFLTGKSSEIDKNKLPPTVRKFLDKKVHNSADSCDVSVAESSLKSPQKDQPTANVSSTTVTVIDETAITTPIAETTSNIDTNTPNNSTKSLDVISLNQYNENITASLQDAVNDVVMINTLFSLPATSTNKKLKKIDRGFNFLSPVKVPEATNLNITKAAQTKLSDSTTGVSTSICSNTAGTTTTSCLPCSHTSEASTILSLCTSLDKTVPCCNISNVTAISTSAPVCSNSTPGSSNISDSMNNFSTSSAGTHNCINSGLVTTCSSTPVTNTAVSFSQMAYVRNLSGISPVLEPCNNLEILDKKDTGQLSKRTYCPYKDLNAKSESGSYLESLLSKQSEDNMSAMSNNWTSQADSRSPVSSPDLTADFDIIRSDNREDEDSLFNVKEDEMIEEELEDIRSNLRKLRKLVSKYEGMERRLEDFRKYKKIRKRRLKEQQLTSLDNSGDGSPLLFSEPVQGKTTEQSTNSVKQSINESSATCQSSKYKTPPATLNDCDNTLNSLSSSALNHDDTISDSSLPSLQSILQKSQIKNTSNPWDSVSNSYSGEISNNTNNLNNSKQNDLPCLKAVSGTSITDKQMEDKRPSKETPVKQKYRSKSDKKRKNCDSSKIDMGLQENLSEKSKCVKTVASPEINLNKDSSNSYVEKKNTILTTGYVQKTYGSRNNAGGRNRSTEPSKGEKKSQTKNGYKNAEVRPADSTCETTKKRKCDATEKSITHKHFKNPIGQNTKQKKAITEVVKVDKRLVSVTHIKVAYEYLFIATNSLTLFVYDMKSQNNMQKIPLEGLKKLTCFEVGMNRDRKILYIGCKSSSIVGLCFHSWNVVQRFSFKSHFMVTCMSFIADKLFAGFTTGNYCYVKPEANTCSHMYGPFSTKRPGITCMQPVKKENTELLLGTKHGCIYVISMSGLVVSTIYMAGKNAAVAHMQVMDDTLYAVSANKTIHIYECTHYSEKKVIDCPTMYLPVSPCSVSTMLYTIHPTKYTIVETDLRTGKCIQMYQSEHGAGLKSLCASEEDKETVVYAAAGNGEVTKIRPAQIAKHNVNLVPKKSKPAEGECFCEYCHVILPKSLLRRHQKKYTCFTCKGCLCYHWKGGDQAMHDHKLRHHGFSKE